MYAASPNLNANDPVSYMLDPANALAAYAATATGGVTADSIAKQNMNKCAASLSNPQLLRKQEQCGKDKDEEKVIEGPRELYVMVLNKKLSPIEENSENL